MNQYLDDLTGFPFSFVHGELSDDSVFAALVLKKSEYYWTFRSIMAYWAERLPNHRRYILEPVPQLRKILKTPQDWLEVGCYLADATEKTFENGSHSFIASAVPGLVDGGIVHTKVELIQGIDILLKTINSLGFGEHFFEIAARRMLGEKIKSLDDLRRQTYTQDDINEHSRYLHNR